MKTLTADEARELARNCKQANRMLRRILRKIHYRAKRGEYSLSYPTKGIYELDRQVCESLKKLGYQAAPSMLGTHILVYWNEKGEE